MVCGGRMNDGAVWERWQIVAVESGTDGSKEQVNEEEVESAEDIVAAPTS